MIVFYTDGTVECQNSEEEYFGYERLQRFLWENKKLPARALVEKFYLTLQTFCEGRPYDDDVTMAVVKRTVTSAQPRLDPRLEN